MSYQSLPPGGELSFILLSQYERTRVHPSGRQMLLLQDGAE
jgi:hypothetical protein